MSHARRVAVVGVVIALSGTVLAAQQTAHLPGTVRYRERIALAPTAVVEVRLDDVTRSGAAPPVIATTRLENPGQVPIKFDLRYDPRLIDPRGRYAVRATITDGGVLLFASLDTALVLTQGHGPRADLLLTRVGDPPKVAPAPPPAPPLPPNPVPSLPATFVGTLPCADCNGIRYHLNLFPDDSFFLRMTYAGKPGDPVDEIGSWALSSDRRVLVLRTARDQSITFDAPSPGTLRKLDADGRPVKSKGSELTRASVFRGIDVNVSFRGSYSRMADAGAIVECSTGQRWTVATPAASQELERALMQARAAEGASVLVEAGGTVSERPGLEGAGTERIVAIARLTNMTSKESCALRFTSAPLTDTQWRLTRLGDRVIPAAADPKRDLSLQFQARNQNAMGSYWGSTGCNRLIGNYTLANATMTLASAGTMQACKDAAATEAAFVAALKATRAYRVAGRTLELFDAKGATLARFEARTPAGITVR